MAFQWQVDPQDLFVERYPQMVGTGLPKTDVDTVRAAITDMWLDGPGGWVREWSTLAEGYVAGGQHRLAALAYGWAKFPTLADESKRAALSDQVDQYLLAAPDFGLDFTRLTIEAPYRGMRVDVPVHLLTPPGWSAADPVLLVSGGVDSWKIDLHSLFADLALRTGMRVLAFDIPGTGETPVPMSADGGYGVVRAIIDRARTLGDGRVAHLGVSMGGWFAARSGLAAEVDAAIVLGGPIERAFDPDRAWVFGMRGIIGNAMGFDADPTDAELAQRMSQFSLRQWLDRDWNAPMLVLNGADDVHIPATDTLVFEGRRDTEVHLLPDTGHCAITKLPEATRIMIDWLDAARW
ncbi:alpha/beta fold hydrolase [Nocardia aurantiaca]|uniref:Alpha/beta fold hydrolase n=1 Tax=Nocardia aurantiaca TaxID=2675850 RepID=A0A6I3KZ95_9NOCA|nr:alpha/beta fold hydrolase [Nocardia aurantiaca]MTE15382.1 alpha/beta fold hydrolase [Nocardia aurantiaca]